MSAVSLKILEDIFESGIEAEAHREAWWAIAHHARPELGAQMNRYPAYFALSERAHFNSAVINLAHLFDRRRDVSTIDRYVKLATRLYSDTEIANVRRRLAQHAKAAAGIIEIRNNVVAHKSAARSTREVFAAAQMTPRLIAALIAECAALVRFFAGREGLSNRVEVLSGVGQATLAIIRAIPRHAA